MSARGWTTPTLAPPGGAPASRSRADGDERLPRAPARLAAFLALAAFGAHGWMQMVRPAASGAMALVLLAALAAGPTLIAIAARRLRAPARAAAIGLSTAVLLVVALAIAGVPGDLLGPRSWDDAAAGIGQGLSAVPNVRVPYSGADEWTRIVIVLGGVALVAVALLLAFAPRRDDRLGFPSAAAIALATLYLVPSMQREGDHAFLGGAVFALLLALFLWLERVDRRSAPWAAGVVAAAVLGALVLAPAVDAERPLVDYEQLAQSLTAAPSTRYDWNHAYGPLRWPREASVVLRVKADHRSYWKAANLPFFDGTRWLQAREPAPGGLNGWFDPDHRDWLQTIRVAVRALRSSLFIAAGTTFEIRDSPREPVQTGFGVFSTKERPLRRGNAYRAVVYTPRPSMRELRAASSYPQLLGSELTTILLPGRPGRSGTPTRGAPVALKLWGEGPDDPATVRAIEESPYARAYELAQRLKARAANPHDFVVSVEEYLGQGFRYTETPPRSDVPLADFLFRDKAGYCQHFSGAMALLLRLGGVPARVAAGFSPGVYDSQRREFVVRDLDAHSWVEVLFGGIGWVTRDPTPSDSPARSQEADGGRGGGDAEVAIREPGGPAAERPSGASGGDAGDGASAGGGGSALPTVLVAGALLAFGGLALVLVSRRRSRVALDDRGAGALAELLRALRRSGRSPAPQTTLETLAARYRGTCAEGYVRTLQSARYGYGAGRPTHEERTALRRELASGLGLRGRLRAWWALPPRLGARPGRRGMAADR